MIRFTSGTRNGNSAPFLQSTPICEFNRLVWVRALGPSGERSGFLSNGEWIHSPSPLHSVEGENEFSISRSEPRRKPPTKARLSDRRQFRERFCRMAPAFAEVRHRSARSVKTPSFVRHPLGTPGVASPNGCQTTKAGQVTSANQSLKSVSREVRFF